MPKTKRCALVVEEAGKVQLVLGGGPEGGVALLSRAPGPTIPAVDTFSTAGAEGDLEPTGHALPEHREGWGAGFQERKGKAKDAGESRQPLHAGHSTHAALHVAHLDSVFRSLPGAFYEASG